MTKLLTGDTHFESNNAQTQFNRLFLVAIGVTFLISMHFFMPNPGGTGLELPFNPIVWISLSVAISIGLYQLSNVRKLFYSKLTIVLFICCIIITIPIFAPDFQPQAALGRLIGLWAGFILFVILQQFKFTNEQKQTLLWFILLAVIIEAIYGYVQYLILQPGNIFYYNTVYNQPYGIFQQTNVMASFLATGLVLSGYLLAHQPQMCQRHVTLLTVIPLILIPLLIIIVSRTGWFAAIIATLLILPYLFYSTSKQRFGFWLLSILLGIIIGTLLVNIDATQSKRSELITAKTKSQGHRNILYRQGVNMIMEKPITGYGYGKFEHAYIYYTAKQNRLNTDYPAGTPGLDHAHNELIMWWVEGGILPVISILLTMLFVLYKIKNTRNGERLALLALFVPIVLHSQLEYPFYHSAIHWIIFIILLYWLDQQKINYQQINFSFISKTVLRVISLTLPFVTAFYMFSTLYNSYILTQFEKSQPRQIEILEHVKNPIVWKDRFDWDLYTSYLAVGLNVQNPTLIQPYIDWSLEIIKREPRPAVYTNLILAYQGLNNESKTRKIREEAQFLFPEYDFTDIKYIVPSQTTHAPGQVIE